MIRPHGYLTEPEWMARNAPDPETMGENLAVCLAVVLIVVGCGWLMLTGGAQ